MNIKKAWYRYWNPVQVGDIWEMRNINPFDEREYVEILEIKKNWCKVIHMSTGDENVFSFYSLKFYHTLVKEQQ